MPYNWKCCSLYPNNFGASALHWACGRASTGQWTTPEGANLINGSTAL